MIPRRVAVSLGTNLSACLGIDADNVAVRLGIAEVLTRRSTQACVYPCWPIRLSHTQ